ncbi:UDP-3-O-(3-hydroxymyristoyl) glucosamine N-acyltransferase [Owenweeksia hongkongensis DSM 17368]|uniref:UDP-3-O-(3-hydroxymyristoyl) glucosamine N-acyltransferase n=1 Tax=Owenweeksia hongkongensis (strain DSM 17368 / CIP 108786 / JCM 12287 / NRRL B-23963 / UST20020801) TaxID=926562 RepID=G8R1P5_OWEHD|nr:UDP-3-O-(3-hydroxymyristoyl)glucosamine N-acyltransferase [Owenweeksia hongkongensis]AEV32821.1 UDP-3-O-(3-hydroxymyristoyl) glucosamine N-acyltransferase [Owenweeksia hongkongensis DSM 17368]
MKLPKPHSLAEMADFLDCEFVGSPEHSITGINEIHVVEPGDIVFVDHPKYYDKALNSAATTILINKKVEAPKGKGLLISDDPFRDFNKITKNFMPFTPASASISSSASIGANTVIQPNAFIGNNVVIGENCIIHSNVSIYDNTVIGNDVIIHANTVIGADAFYYKKREDGFDRLLSGGNVVIEDRVEIGASCTIDKGVSGSTRIGYDSKLDNHIQIGHDTSIGKHCLIASQVGVAGCVVIEDHVTLWGQVGITSGVTIGEKSVVLAQSGIARSLKGGTTYFGSPAEEARKKYRELASIRILPELIEKITIKDS